MFSWWWVLKWLFIVPNDLRVLLFLSLGDVGGDIFQRVFHLYLFDNRAEGVWNNENHYGQADYENDAGGQNISYILQGRELKYR